MACKNGMNRNVLSLKWIDLLLGKYSTLDWVFIFYLFENALILELAKQANKQRNKSGKIITRQGNEDTFFRMAIQDNETIKSRPNTT